MIIFQFFHFCYIKIFDIIKYYKNKEWLIFNGFGLHFYVGLFGSGKTSTMVHDAYKLACKYPSMSILTNMSLFNFPEHTNIILMKDYKQIISAPPDTLILIDEISSIFNSRDWKKGGIPAPLLSTLLQVRKERKMLYATAQRFQHVDALFRQITFTVRQCECWLNRWNFINIFDGFDYENSNVVKTAVSIDSYSFVQTDKVRKLYDTTELIQKIVTTDFISDKEILEKQAVNPNPFIAPEKKSFLTKKVQVPVSPQKA
jgi:hypothetical protein